MRLNVTDKSFMVTLKYGTTGRTNLKVDTGASVSTLSFESLNLLTSYDMHYFKRLLNSVPSITLRTLNGTIHAGHIYLRNCVIDDTTIPYFHCMFSNVSQSVLGMDFILAGKLVGSRLGACIEEFDYNVYRQRVINSYGVEAYEISCLDSVNDVFDKYCIKYGVSDDSRDIEKKRLCSLFGWDDVSNHLSELREIFLGE